MLSSPSDVAAIALQAFADGDAAQLLRCATAASAERWSRVWRNRITEAARPRDLKHPPDMPDAAQAYNLVQWTKMLAREVADMQGTFDHAGPIEDLLNLSDTALLNQAWGGMPAAQRKARQLPGDIRDGEHTAYVLAAFELRHHTQSPSVLTLVRTEAAWQLTLEPEALYAFPGLAGLTYNARWLALSADAE